MSEETLPDASASIEEPSGGEEGENSEVDSLKATIAELEHRASAANDSMLRALADLQNYRRRAAAEVDRARNSAIGELALRLIPVVDNFERTITAANEGASRDSLIEGIRILDRQFRESLAALRIEKIVALGSPFNPELHEVVITEPSESDEGIVIEEIEPGYMIGKELLKPAKVKVSKGREV